MGSIRPLDVAVVCIAAWALFKLVKATRGRKVKTTKLKGPPNKSFIFGHGQVLDKADDSALLYEQWADEHGVAYELSSAFGQSRIVLFDPKAVGHFYPRETTTYILTPLSRTATASLAGKGLLWSHGESHKRQKKALTPAFSNAAIRRLTSIFFDSAHKTKAVWDVVLESSTDGVINVERWMNRISMDSIGIAGFSHDFGSLDGKPAAVVEVFEEMSSTKQTTIAATVFLLAPMFPWLLRIPGQRQRLLRRLNAAMSEISKELLGRTRQEMQGDVKGAGEDKSILGLLIKSENETAEIHTTPEEVLAQMKLLLIAGYETTSTSMTWALVELAQHQNIQWKLRESLQQFSNGDPTWDQLAGHDLPYLDAVVHEVLRLHPAVQEITRIAAEDDVIPLGTPIQTPSGETIDRLTIAKGSFVTIPMRGINRSVDFWGPDAKEFRPERWLEVGASAGKAKDLQSHRHLLTFADGPRTCLGKAFALAEFKAVMSVLIRNFTFQLRDEKDTVVRGRGIFPRPTVAGEPLGSLPLRVRRVE